MSLLFSGELSLIGNLAYDVSARKKRNISCTVRMCSAEQGEDLKVRNMCLVAEWEGWTGKCLTQGHGVQIAR